MDERRRMAVPLEPRPRILGGEGEVREEVPSRGSVNVKEMSDRLKRW